MRYNATQSNAIVIGAPLACCATLRYIEDWRRRFCVPPRTPHRSQCFGKAALWAVARAGLQPRAGYSQPSQPGRRPDVIMSKYSLLRLVSMLGGLGLVGVAAFLNVSHAAESEGSYLSPVCIAIVALAFGSALAVPVMHALWRTGRKSLALLALAGLVAGESYGLQLSAERLLAAREQRAQQVKTDGSPYAQAQAALELAINERKVECSTGLGRKCSKLRDLEDGKRAALAAIPVPKSVTLLADATGLPDWAVEIAPAMTFSSGLMVLGFVLIGFGAHGSQEWKVEGPAVPEPKPDENERVVNWVRAFRRRHGRDPKIPEVQAVFDLPKTTAWRRSRAS